MLQDWTEQVRLTHDVSSCARSLTHSPTASFPLTKDQVFYFLRRHPPLTTRQLLTAAGIPSNDSAAKSALNRLMYALQGAQLVCSVPDTQPPAWQMPTS